MPEILINVINKIPVLSGDVRQITADNSDYTIRFVFDDQWTDAPKTVYFVRQNGFAYPTARTNEDEVAVPVVRGVEVRDWLYIGVQQGDVKTSRPCGIPVYKAITDLITDDAVQPEPSMWEGVILQIAELERLTDEINASYAKLSDIPPSDIFWVTYGTTKYAEIAEAVAAGRLCVLRNINDIAVMVTGRDDPDFFDFVADRYISYRCLYRVTSDDSWITQDYSVLTSYDKSYTLTENSTNNQIPTAKAVYDAILAHGGSGGSGAAPLYLTAEMDANGRYTIDGYTSAELTAAAREREVKLMLHSGVRVVLATLYPDIGFVGARYILGDVDGVISVNVLVSVLDRDDGIEGIWGNVIEAPGGGSGSGGILAFVAPGYVPCEDYATKYYRMPIGDEPEELTIDQLADAYTSSGLTLMLISDNGANGVVRAVLRPAPENVFLETLGFTGEYWVESDVPAEVVPVTQITATIKQDGKITIRFAETRPSVLHLIALGNLPGSTGIVHDTNGVTWTADSLPLAYAERPVELRVIQDPMGTPGSDIYVPPRDGVFRMHNVTGGGSDGTPRAVVFHGHYWGDDLAGWVPAVAVVGEDGRCTVADAAWDGYARKSEIPTSLPASDVYAWAKAPDKPTYTAGEVGAATSQQFTQLSEAIADLSTRVTPQMYGAVGDGVTDDTQAFKEALKNGNNVFVPQGVYVISSELNLTQGKSLFGENGNRGTLKFTGESGNIIVLGEDSVFTNVDIWIPQKVDGNVFITDNRLINTTVSFLHSIVENTTIQMDAVQSESSAKKLTLINIVASNEAQGFCYQLYRNINVIRPNWEGLDMQAIYTYGIKMTLSADAADKTSLSWITHLNFENVFLGAPVTAIICNRENNSGVDLSGVTRIIEHILMSNVSAQVASGYSKKFWDLAYCQIKAINCKAWDYAEYVTDGKYGTIRKGARLSILPLETSPVDNFEFPDETSSSATANHVRLIDRYFTLIKPSAEGGTSVNDPRIARRLSAENGVYNYTDTICPERLSNSIHKISGNAATLRTMGFSDYQIFNGLQLNDGGFLGTNGAHTTILGITQDNHWVFRKYYSGDWFGDWHRIYSDTDDELLKQKITVISDAGNYFAKKNVEDALQEIGAKLQELEGKLSN